MNYTPRKAEELEQLAKDVIELNTPDKPPTPRTDAEHAKTLTPAYEYEGAEHEAWECSRKIEKMLIHWKERCLLAEDYISESPCDPDIYPEQMAAYQKWQDIKPRHFSELF